MVDAPDIVVDPQGTTTIHTLPSVGQKADAGSVPVTQSTEQIGVPVTGITLPTGSGFYGWLSGIYGKLNTSVAQDGTDATGITPLTGSVGIRGWLSSSFSILSSLLAGQWVAPASGKTAVTGSFSAAGQSASFTPIAGRAFNVSVWGTFVGSVQLEHSFDAGTTWLPITAAGMQLYVWTTPASETAEEDEVGTIVRLNCTLRTSGTFSYRISQ